MKRLFTILYFAAFLTLTSVVVNAQATPAVSMDTTTYFGKVNYIFEHVDKNQITTGLLREYGIDFLNLDNYTGAALNDSNFVSMDEWRFLYASLYSEQMNGNAQVGLPYLDTINNRAARYSYPDRPVTFAVLFYQYQSLKPNTITDNLMTVSNDQLYDVLGRTESPYQMNTLFAVAPARQAALTGTVELMFRPDMFFGNTGKNISTLQIDTKGIGVYQTVSMNIPISVNYDTSGFYDLNFKITYTDGTIRVAHSKLVVYENPNVVASIARYGERTTINAPITADKAYLGGFALGDITIELSEHNTTGQVRNPLIVVEGFDPYNDYDYFSFVHSIAVDDNSGTPITLSDDLDNIGQYDLIFVNWHNSTDYIQRNAYLLEKVIDSVNNMKITFDGVRQENVILGLSMGGLVVRYALRDMELHSEDHECRLFISHDTPFWGASVPVAFQALVQQLGNWKIINANGNFPFISWEDMIPAAADGLDLLNSPAARQMLIQYYNINQSSPTSSATLVADNSIHNAFMNELKNMGWPQQCKIMTLSNGSCNGTKPFSYNATLFRIQGDRGMTYLGSLWRSLALSIFGMTDNGFGTVFGGTNQGTSSWAELWQFPLSLFSTSSSIVLDFRGRAVPIGVNYEIYRGDIYSHKKILGIFNVNNYFIKCHLSSSPEMLPLANAPGGEYDINQFRLDESKIENSLPDFFQEYVQATILQPKFCFVPTVSSLAFTNPENFLSSNICNKIACNNPAVVTNYYVPISNQLHISYTQASGDWLMRVQDSSYDVVQVCTGNLHIAGRDYICDSTIYEISGIPTGTTVTWSASPSGKVSFTPIGDGSRVKIKKLYSGISTITATMSGSSFPVSYTTSKKAIVGTPSFMGTCCFTGSDPFLNTLNFFSGTGAGRVQLDPTIGYSSYNWTLSSGIVDWWTQAYEIPYGSQLNFDIGPNQTAGYQFAFELSATNTCGTLQEEYFFYYTGLYGHSFTVSPNPAQNRITLSLNLNKGKNNLKKTKLSKQSAKSFRNIKYVNIYNVSGKLIKEETFSKNSTHLQMDISHLPGGIYFVEISDGRKKAVQKLVIAK